MIKKSIKSRIVTKIKVWHFTALCYSKTMLNTAINGSFEPLFLNSTPGNLCRNLLSLKDLLNFAPVAQLDSALDFEDIVQSQRNTSKIRGFKAYCKNLQQDFTTNFNRYCVFCRFCQG